MSVSTTFDFDAAEHYRATRVVNSRSSMRYVTWGFVALSPLMLAWSVLPRLGEAPTGDLLVSALPWLLLPAFWLVVIPMLQRRGAHKLSTRDPSVRGPQTRIVDAEGYHSRGNGVSVDVPWHAMTRGVEVEQFFLFYYSKQFAYYLPKRVLAPADIVTVRALMRERLQDRAEVRPE